MYSHTDIHVGKEIIIECIKEQKIHEQMKGERERERERQTDRQTENERGQRDRDRNM